MRVLVLLAALVLPSNFLMQASSAPSIWTMQHSAKYSLIHQCAALNELDSGRSNWGVPQDLSRSVYGEAGTPRARLQVAVHDIGSQLSRTHGRPLRQALAYLKAIDASSLCDVDLYVMTFAEAAYFYQQGELTPRAMKHAGELLVMAPQLAKSATLCLRLLRWCFAMTAGVTGDELVRLAEIIEYLGELLADSLSVDGVAELQKTYGDLHDAIIVAMRQRAIHPEQTPKVVFEALCSEVEFELKLQAHGEATCAVRVASGADSWLPARPAGSPPLGFDGYGCDDTWSVGYHHPGAGK